MRKLGTRDTFAAMRIIKTAGVIEEVKKIAVKANGTSANAEEIGVEIIFNVLGKICEKDCEKLIFEFASGLFEADVKTIEEMPPTEFCQKLLECADLAEWKRFFMFAARAIQELN